jgi:hypothetical protein
MSARLFRKSRAADPSMRSFAYRIVPWESNRWHVSVFLAGDGGDLAVVGVGLVHRGRQAATYERNVDVEDVTATRRADPSHRVLRGCPRPERSVEPESRAGGSAGDLPRAVAIRGTRRHVR